jgi:hypothetical protein
LGGLARIMPFGVSPAGVENVLRIFSIMKIDGVFGRDELGWAVYRGRQLLYETLSLDAAVDWAEQELMLAVADEADGWILVHAGVVVWDGLAIVLPGFSFSGKTTLTLELVRLGATYYSDEYAVIDADGNIHPYPRPPGVRDTTNQDASLVAHAGWAALPPVRACVIAALTFEAGSHMELREGTRAQGVMHLLQHAVPARNPGRTLPPLTNASRDARVVYGSRGEAANAASRILQVAASMPHSRSALRNV